jgi:enamine deaminase RidA (YjgF/YER057c/UK114 family)
MAHPPLHTPDSPPAAPAIHRQACDGIGYTIAELNDVEHVFAAAVPRLGRTLDEQAANALQIIQNVNGLHGSADAIVHQAVFVSEAALIPRCQQIMREFYGPNMPATSYIPQPPCDGRLLAIEALGMSRKSGDVRIDRLGEQLVTVRHNGITWIHAAHAVPQGPSPRAYDQAFSAFQHLRTLLESAHTRMDQVLRTWIYQGGIVAPEGQTQRYKELNRARGDAYKNVAFLADRLPKRFPGVVYPASTGIGALGRGISISAIALATDRTDIVAVPLENPRQTSAYQYGAHYSPKAPMFARGMAVSCGNMATIFISGTASITHSETLHLGDAAAQTHETLDNIEALIGEENLARHGLPGLGASRDGLGYVRVYIKRQEDYPRVRAVCEQRLGNLPTIYALADVCRPELLVEIEGMAISYKQN